MPALARELGFTMSTIVYGGLGWCAVALAIAGAMLPGVPTTVFVLAASYCFSRSSPRFAQWLRDNRRFGPTLRRFASADGMSRSTKRAVLTGMWSAVVVSAATLIWVHPIVALCTVGLGAVGTLSVLFGVRTADV